MKGSFVVLCFAVLCVQLTLCRAEDPIKHPDCPPDESPQYPTHLPYPGDCTKFYKCLEGWAYPIPCPPGLHWSVELTRCDWPNVAKCQK